MQTLAPFLAGLGLFFCGIHFLSANLVPLAGRQFRSVLRRFGHHIWAAAVFGSVAGAVMQSTHAVTSVVMGLVNGGLIDKRRAILTPTWSHVGTSLLVMLVAIDLRLAASYLIAIAGGAIFFRLNHDDRIRHAVGTLLGLGLLFLGIQTLHSGADVVGDILVADGMLASAVKHPLLLLLIGAALSLICQSSSVASALAVAATTTGIVDFPSACWLVFGANLGSSGNYILLARHYEGESAQIAWMQAVQKVSAFAIILGLIAVERATGRLLIETGIMSIAKTPSGQVATMFLIYQVVGSLFCSVFVNPIMRVLERVVRPSPLQELSKPMFLIDDALVEPSFAIEMVGREERRQLERLPAMLDGMRADVEGPVTPAVTLRDAGVAVTRAMAGYLDLIIEAGVERSDREQVVRLQHRTANLNAMYETLGDFVVACGQAAQWPSSGRVADQMIESAHALLVALVDAAGSDDAVDRELLLNLLSHRDELMERIRQRVMRDDPDLPAAAREALFSATMLFERLIWLARRGAVLLSPERQVQVEAAA